MYEYTGAGWCKRQDEKRCEHMIATCSEKVFKLHQVSKWEWEETFPFSSEGCTNSAFKYALKRLYLEPPPNRHFRAFKNGTVDMRTGELLPHDPAHYLTSAIESDYVRDRPCPDVFLNFITSAFGEDQLDAVRAYTSMLIDPTALYGKFIHIIGPSGSGKGTLLRLWGEIFGLEDSHSGDFSELANPESRHQHLTGKSLYTIPDTGGYITGIRPFYELVDNGKLSGRSLYSSCGYTKEWNCRFVAASVDHLQIENAGDGWDRRCLPLLSKGREGLEDPYLRHKLSAVKADIVSWALAMPELNAMPCCCNLPPTTASALPNSMPLPTATRYAASLTCACDRLMLFHHPKPRTPQLVPRLLQSTWLLGQPGHEQVHSSPQNSAPPTPRTQTPPRWRVTTRSLDSHDSITGCHGRCLPS
jgi:energy-coupling factor transporter ATP-binding protein EcfA2